MKRYFFFLVALLAIATNSQAQTIRIAVDALPPSLGNPFRSSLAPTVYSTAAVFDTLTRFDSQAVLQPALAVRWENIDPLTWRFHLRPGVVFSNGAPFTADAVVNAVEYLVSDAANREGMKRELTVLKAARAINDLTVEIVSTEPVPFFPRYVTALPLVEPTLWRTLGRDGFALKPVGTGPFKVDKIAANRWELSVSATSWRKPKLARVEILALPDTAARSQALEAAGGGPRQHRRHRGGRRTREHLFGLLGLRLEFHYHTRRTVHRRARTARPEPGS
jgi:peptide/nickel transport system substrate-binding protein